MLPVSSYLLNFINPNNLNEMRFSDAVNDDFR